MARKRANKGKVPVGPTILDPYKVLNSWHDGRSAYLAVYEELEDGSTHECVGSTSLRDEKGKDKKPNTLRNELILACNEKIQEGRRIIGKTGVAKITPLDLGIG